MAWLHVALWFLGLLGAGPSLADGVPGVLWMPGPVLDQGGSSACATFALVTLLESGPRPVRGPDPLQLYAAAQLRDGGEPGHRGTSVEAALDLLTAEGFVSEWARTQGLGESLAWLRARGPLVVEGPCGDMLIGMPWPHATCDDPAGSHAWVCYGEGPGPLLRCQTSWGTALGRFRWSVAALARTLADDGRVFLIAKRAPRLRFGVWAD